MRHAVLDVFGPLVDVNSSREKYRVGMHRIEIFLDRYYKVVLNGVWEVPVQFLGDERLFCAESRRGLAQSDSVTFSRRIAQITSNHKT